MVFSAAHERNQSKGSFAASQRRHASGVRFSPAAHDPATGRASGVTGIKSSGRQHFALKNCGPDDDSFCDGRTCKSVVPCPGLDGPFPVSPQRSSLHSELADAATSSIQASGLL